MTSKTIPAGTVIYESMKDTVSTLDIIARGVVRASGDYSTIDLAPGSVIVTIKGSTLSDLTVGGHTVTIEFKDGTAVTSLNVKAAANVVKTGEDMSPALWTGVACVGSAVMLFAAVVAQKKRTAVRKSVRKSVMKF
jgi:hypothetical protein